MPEHRLVRLDLKDGENCLGASITTGNPSQAEKKETGVPSLRNDANIKVRWLQFSNR